jgi:ATP-dependent phosphofructokinase / diphosphate-dependent phosphofructokinase
MSIKKQRIGVLTGGGDCAGLNPAIKWVVNTALDHRFDQARGIKYEVIGIKDGWKGLSFNDENRQEYVEVLTKEKVSNWDWDGGTNLGTSRYNPYSSKINTSKLVIDNIQKELGLDVLIAIGGDDTLSVAARLCQDGVNVIGIPKTIDKDLVGTDYTLGFETAVEVIKEIVDRLRTTAGSHRRVMVVEAMGRTAGWLALRGGEASGASIILIPEFDFSIDKVCELISEKRKAGTRSDIVMIAEGAKPAGQSSVKKDGKVDSFGHETLGGIGEFLSNQINEKLGLESRCVVLGHIQRGGTPCAYDRRMGRYFGIAAVNLAERQQYGKMVSYTNGAITCVPITDVIGKLNLVNIKTQYDVESYNGTRDILVC